MKQVPKRKKQEEVVTILADKYGVSTSYVNKVIAGNRNNDCILSDYITYKQEHNLLIKAIEKAVPFDQLTA